MKYHEKNVVQRIAMILVGAGMLLAACEREKAPPAPPPLDPLTACRGECRATSERMFRECTDRLRAQGAFDRLSECNTDADAYYEECRTECREQYYTQASPSE